MGCVSQPCIDSCDEYLIGYGVGYAEVVESLTRGEVYDAEVFINELGDATVNYRLGYRRGVEEAISDAGA